MNSRADRGKGLPGLLVGAVLAISTLLAGIVVFSSAACSSDSLRKGLSGPAASTPEDLLAELKNDKARIDQVSDEMMRRIETFNASRRPGERTIQFSEVFYEELTPEQRDVLNTLLAEEKDVSYKSLIQGIIKDRDTIKALQDKVLHLEQSLPDKFVVAAKGDSHHDLAMDYLQTEAKVDKEKAKKLLAEVDQTDELIAGNKVWFFYDPERDSFRTYVTQGTAGQTPLVVRRALKRQLVTERDAAQAKVNDLEQTKAQLETQISGLNNDIQILGDRRTELETEVAGLQQNKTQLENKVTDLSADLAFRQNSLFYHAASEQELKDKGVLSSVLKRVQDVKGVEYEQALDLRQSTTLTLTPGTYGLSHIKSVRLLPSIFQEGRDFTVETSEDGTAAKLNILDPSMFRGKEVLVSVKG